MDFGIALSCPKALACTYYAAHESCSSAAPHDVDTIFMAHASALHIFIAPASVVCTFAMNALITYYLLILLITYYLLHE